MNSQDSGTAVPETKKGPEVSPFRETIIHKSQNSILDFRQSTAAPEVAPM